MIKEPPKTITAMTSKKPITINSQNKKIDEASIFIDRAMPKNRVKIINDNNEKSTIAIILMKNNIIAISTLINQLLKNNFQASLIAGANFLPSKIT